MEMLPTFTHDQMLAIWQAITLLGEAGEYCDTIERSEILADIEIVLMDVVSQLVRSEKNGNIYAFPVCAQ
jgi:hypothetical protein